MTHASRNLWAADEAGRLRGPAYPGPLYRNRDSRASASGLVLLDYRLNSTRPPPNSRRISARVSRRAYLVLSDLWALPADIAPFVSGFVRKGEPAKLLETVAEYFAARTGGRRICSPARPNGD